MNRLDFDDIPDLTYTRAFAVIRGSVLATMAKLPETLERAQCAVYFAYRIRKSDTDDIWIRQGYMRAALAEFVGMESALSRDLVKLGITKPLLRANSGTKPLLHIIRELRNFELHLHSSILSEEKKWVIWGSEDREFELAHWFINDLTEAQFLELDNSERYHPADVPKLISWFNAAQREWGIHDLIVRAAEEFCLEIITGYSLGSSSPP